jgi:mxaA protein
MRIRDCTARTRLVLAVSALAFCAASAAVTPAVIQQPRPFGYVLGDTLVQRILLQVAGHNFEPTTLPPSERAGLWFSRRSSRVEVAEDGRRWLVIDYQLVNAPQTLMTVNLPSVTLKSQPSGNPGDDAFEVPEWPISIAPLTPRAAFAKGGLQELRPDHPAPTLPTAALRRQAAAWSIAFAGIVAIWLGWWLVRHLRAAANQPFARALREIRRSADGGADAWLAMHRAFDRTAGRAVHLSTLPALFQLAPHLEPQRSAIEQFYAESNRRFFEVPPAAVSAQPVSLRTLCATLRKIEKKHER